MQHWFRDSFREENVRASRLEKEKGDYWNNKTKVLPYFLLYMHGQSTVINSQRTITQ